MDRRVAITGMGVITRDAPDLDAFRQVLGQGGNPPGLPCQFDSTAFRSKLGYPTDPEKTARLLDAALRRHGEVLAAQPSDAEAACAANGLLAALDAVARAGLDAATLRGAGCAIGTTSGGMMDSFADLMETDSPDALAQVVAPASAVDILARVLGLSGPLCSFSCACISSLAALSYAFARIRSGDVDIMLAGGSDRMREADFAGFNALRAMDRDSCRPFDETRNGMMIGDGAAILVLEEEQAARARGATPLAWLSGMGLATDSHHITSPNPHGLTRAMQQALAQARRAPGDIDYVNCHGTATPLNDVAEAEALRAVFGSHRPRPMISSTKGSTGHLLGTAGAIETVATVLALQTGDAPVMTTTHTPLETGFPLPLSGADRRIGGRIAMKNSLGFGGLNASLILERCPETEAR
ncbi:beta-ketoacyl-[acyl-carrier-protein] synthase family protein [uncultured Roseobacter sp.]|uniref:beta-ketoacyl-[acyl-carrier-protein] synthase family protein n=1 Tax=uncultured Roseobacter sp. TaxID=114847 RepID=UPI00260E040C|nr:beta-ketoacyl-[acyl-carrier-protein] synthase family protein [uncultured Roseobacter sp.]